MPSGSFCYVECRGKIVSRNRDNDTNTTTSTTPAKRRKWGVRETQTKDRTGYGEVSTKMCLGVICHGNVLTCSHLDALGISHTNSKNGSRLHNSSNDSVYLMRAFLTMSFMPKAEYQQWCSGVDLKLRPFPYRSNKQRDRIENENEARYRAEHVVFAYRRSEKVKGEEAKRVALSPSPSSLRDPSHSHKSLMPCCLHTFRSITARH
ncbi:hypothetical protein F5Y18DRAFT_305325 [Xylariaceae sp. FL1019]|nr:hypothetical protein F5Y18DRAFT_305325 [Xylariaceae sp. FL1019]